MKRTGEKYGKEQGQAERSPVLAGGNGNWCGLWETAWCFLLKLSGDIRSGSAISLLGIYQQKEWLH